MAELQIPLHHPHGPDIRMLPPDGIVNQTPDDDAEKHHDGPIHRARLHRRRDGPEREEQDGRHEDERGDVDREPVFPQRPAAHGQGVAV